MHKKLNNNQKRYIKPTIKPGSYYPLGATFNGIGTNFAVFSEIAEKIELCLFSTPQNGSNEPQTEQRIEITERDNFIWHIYVEGISPGQEYGFRVYGPNNPECGQYCNPNKLLLDPYAKAISGEVDTDESLYNYYWSKSLENEADEDGNCSVQNDHGQPINNLDSANHTMKSVVISPYFDWGNDSSPNHSYSESIIYEAHVKGLTMQNLDIPEQKRGTYAGMAHPSTIKYLKELGITTVELMPIHQFINDPSLQEKGLNNYWGYNTIGFFAPHNKYTAFGDKGQQVNEFKEMVKTLHENDIEVILDVVYNHTAEGNHKGPILSLKGLDNANYYRLVNDDWGYYFDTTGTGNSLLMKSPATLQLIMDSLRYWVQEMHVDGFRFDLAATLARQFHDVDKLSAFFDIIHQDPIISQVKLIAEPWDLGDGGYQVGGFPNMWSEWNGKYRDSIRDFWRSEDGSLNEFATRITGSADLYAHTGRKPVASVNFITAHDGFTLRDLVTYNDKHNDANQEGGNDGESHNRSWNCGVEGETDDQDIIDLRLRQQKNFLATLLLSLGIPMILHGDEFGRTQDGNNNTYCQDTPISWVNWNLDENQQETLNFSKNLIHYRKKHPVLHRANFFSVEGDAIWYDREGNRMNDEDWNNYFAKTTILFLDGDKVNAHDEHGQKIKDDSFLIIFNGHYEEMEFTLPTIEDVKTYELIIDTMLGEDAFTHDDERYPVTPGKGVLVEQRSLRLYKAIKG
jgi:glycogen operon protein